MKLSINYPVLSFNHLDGDFQSVYLRDFQIKNLTILIIYDKQLNACVLWRLWGVFPGLKIETRPCDFGFNLQIVKKNKSKFLIFFAI